MKLTKHRLKEIISEELDSLEEATNSFDPLQTRVKMAQLSIEDVMEKFVRSKENFDQFREEE